MVTFLIGQTNPFTVFVTRRSLSLSLTRYNKIHLAFFFLVFFAFLFIFSYQREVENLETSDELPFPKTTTLALGEGRAIGEAIEVTLGCFASSAVSL